MTADRRFETLLTEWLDATASEQDAAAVHDQSMAVVRRSRPRPAWLVVVRGGTMGSTAQRLGRAGRTTVYLLVILGLILALLAAVVVGGRLLQARLPSPYGPAENGIISFSKDGDIWTANRDGSDPRLLIDDEAEDGWPLFSPDGTRFIFDRTLPDGGHQVMVANANGKDARAIADVPSPLEDWTWTDWSPDSQSLVVLWAGDDGPAIAILHVDGSPPTVLQLGDLVPTDLASWRPPDGREIIFEADPADGGPRGVYAIDPDIPAIRPVGVLGRAGDEPFQHPALSPDGKLMTFWNWEANDAGIWGPYQHVRDLDTGEDRAVSLDPLNPGIGMMGRFTPDSESLVFESGNHAQGPPFDSQLVLARVDGTGPSLALGPSYNGADRESFDISPDGTKVILDLAGVTWFIDTTTGQATKAPEYLPNQPSWQRR